MDSALYAYIFDIGWFLLLTGALLFLAMGLIVFRTDFWERTSYEGEKERTA
jgi:hypothetical protein